MCLSFGVFVLCIFGQVTVVACVRIEPRQVDCQVRETWAGWLPMGRPHIVRNVRLAQAQVEPADYYDQPDRIYLELSTAEGATDISFTNLPNAERAAGQINGFIREGRAASSEVRDAWGWFPLSCGLFLFADALFFSVLML